MLRIIVREDYAGMAIHVGGSVLTTFKTFDIEHPELEALLRAEVPHGHTQVTGVEVLPAGEAS